MTGMIAAGDDADIDLGKLAGAIWRRRLTIVLLVVLAGIAAFAVTSLMQPLYQAETTLLIQTRDGLTGGTDGTSSAEQPILDERGVTSQVQILQSADLIRSVAKKLDLADRPEFAGKDKPSLTARLMAMVGLKAHSAPVSREQQVVTRFRDLLNVYPVANSRVIVIQFSSRDAQLAAAVPNEMAKEYLADQSAQKLADENDAAAWLEPEIDRLRSAVNDAESKAADYRAKNGLLTVDNNNSLLGQELTDTASELSKVRSERIDAEARASSVEDALKNGRSADTLANVVDSPLIQQLRQQEVAIQAQLADLSTTLGSRHPRIQALKSQVAELDRRIKAESQKVLDSLKNEARIATRREQELNKQMNDLKTSAGRAGQQQVKLQALERDAAADRDLLNTYLARYREASSRSSRDALPADARIISNAVAPSRPYFPKTVPIVIVAMLAAFLVSSVAVMLVELFSGRALRPVGRPVSEAEEPMERPRPVLTPIARNATSVTAIQIAARGARDGDEDAEEMRRAAEDAARHAAAAEPAEPIGEEAGAEPAVTEEDVAAGEKDGDFSIASAAERLIGKGGSTVICISPEGDEGSAASIILSRLLAEQDLRTVLVDMTDSALPSQLMARSDGLAGLTDLLAGQITFAESIHGDRLSPAHIVPRGLAGSHQAMRAADRLPMILDGLRDAYEFVVVECGAKGAADVAKLLRSGTSHDIIVNAVEPGDEEIAETLKEFYRAGHDDLIVMMPSQASAERDTGTHAA